MLRFATIKSVFVFVSVLIFSNALSAENNERQLTIKMYQGQELQETIGIPVSALEFISSLIPPKINAELENEGFNVEGILKAVREDKFKGTLVTIEDATTNSKTVVSIE